VGGCFFVVDTETRGGGIRLTASCYYKRQKDSVCISDLMCVRDERSYVIHSFVDLCGTCQINGYFVVFMKGHVKSACILWNYAGLVNQFILWI